MHQIPTKVLFPNVSVAFYTTPIIHKLVVTILEYGIGPADVEEICVFQLLVRDNPVHHIGP